MPDGASASAAMSSSSAAARFVSAEVSGAGRRRGRRSMRDDAVRPAHDRLQARGDHLERGLHADPARFLMLGYAQLGIDREGDLLLLAASDVIARDLALVVGAGFHVDEAPIERDVV